MVRSYRIIDLTHDLFVNMPSYPTLPPFRMEYLKLAAKDGSTVNLITNMHTHLGTHVDFPSHIIPESKCLEHYSLEDVLGVGGWGHQTASQTIGRLSWQVKVAATH